VASWDALTTAMGLALMRPMGLLFMLPLFSAQALGGTLARNALVLLIAIPMVPVFIATNAIAPATSLFPTVLMYGREFTIGMIMGFFAAIPFWALDISGFIIDTIRGSSMASVLNPMLGDQTSVFGMVFAQTMAALFLVSGGFNALLVALYGSYAVLPPGTTLSFDRSFFYVLNLQWYAMWELALRFTMPAMAGMLLVDIALGFANRAAPQMNVFFLAMPIKTIVALLLLSVGLHYGLANVILHFEAFPDAVAALTGTLR
jgi:type III secretion protein T